MVKGNAFLSSTCTKLIQKGRKNEKILKSLSRSFWSRSGNTLWRGSCYWCTFEVHFFIYANKHCSVLLLEGTVSRDFWLQVFFMNHSYSNKPLNITIGLFQICSTNLEIFTSLNDTGEKLPQVSTVPVAKFTAATATGINCGGSKCSNGVCLRSQRRRGGSKWSRGGSVDQWSQICITLTRNRIQISIKVKSRIRIRIKMKRGFCIKVMRIRKAWCNLYTSLTISPFSYIIQFILKKWIGEIRLSC